MVKRDRAKEVRDLALETSLNIHLTVEDYNLTSQELILFYSLIAEEMQKSIQSVLIKGAKNE